MEMNQWGATPFPTFLLGKVEGQEKCGGLQLLRQEFLNGMQKYPLKQPNLKKKKKKKYNLIRKKTTAEKKKKKAPEVNQSSIVGERRKSVYV